MPAFALVVACSLGTTHARAEGVATDGDGANASRQADVVFEVRPDTCARIPDDPVRATIYALEQYGRAALPSHVKEVTHGLLPLPGMTDPEMTVAKIRAKFGEAQQKTTGLDWDFDEAIKLYEKGFQWARENQAVVVKDLDTPTWMTEALVGYAKALARAKKADAAKDQYRIQFISFPDLPITESRYGPTAAALYDGARKELDASPHGTLLVTVNRPDATIFINFVGRGRGGNFQANVVAGTYEVLVEVGGKALRYVVKTDPATTKHAELRIDWDIDSRLSIGDASVCVSRVANVRDVLRGLQAKASGRGVVLVSRPVRDGIRWVRAERYEAGSSVPRPTCVARDGDNVGHDLAGCIDGKRKPGVLAEIPAAPREAQSDEEVPSQRRHWLALALTGAGVGAGLYFLSVNGTCAREDASLPGGCAEERDMRLHAGLSLAVGALSFGYAVYAWDRYASAVRRTRGPAVGVGITHGGGVVTVGGSF